MTEPQQVAYGEDPSQYGELTLPDGTPRGVVVVVHGGFWRAAYDLDLGRPLAADLAARGWATWNLEYRRVVGDPGGGPGGGGGAPATLDDVAAGIDRLALLGLDLSTVVALGHSAGGHLAAWSASRGRFERWAAGVPVTHVVSQAGVLDLAAAHDQGLGSGAVEAFLGHPPGPADDPVDPARQLPLDVPLWCVHGRADDVVPISQSEGYVAAATAAGARAELVAVDGDHFVVVDTASPAWARTVAILDTIA
ncbi:prolyl oligopeptidase family serine peptidase [Nocardioides panaciterrulae]|uniref:Acetyl esterase/lipase n=1 Tax=Nocardioides panaciterrulae TaxID=661492 RepID=A0A7Y9E3L9_9ACTN|nr:acetyl esterase/lipase [Nocardioides panaciterrulae]